MSSQPPQPLSAVSTVPKAHPQGLSSQGSQPSLQQNGYTSGLSDTSLPNGRQTGQLQQQQRLPVSALPTLRPVGQLPGGPGISTTPAPGSATAATVAGTPYQNVANDALRRQQGVASTSERVMGRPSIGSSLGTAWKYHMNKDAVKRQLQTLGQRLDPRSPQGAFLAAALTFGFAATLALLRKALGLGRKGSTSSGRCSNKQGGAGRRGRGNSGTASASSADGVGSGDGAVRPTLGSSQNGKAKAPPVKGPFSHIKPSVNCVPLADGSACVVRREIPGDNSCLFNAIGYGMHRNKGRASSLRRTVANTVAGDKEQFTSAFLGMSNDQYCSWIMQPYNWGGGIELSILSKAYQREISAWNIESATPLVFGEESGYKKQVMCIYTGTHYDALAIAKGPNADAKQDETEYNPRSQRGRMIIAAARKLTELTHRASPFYKGPIKASGGNASSAAVTLRCSECSINLPNQAAAKEHASSTGHTKFVEAK